MELSNSCLLQQLVHHYSVKKNVTFPLFYYKHKTYYIKRHQWCLLCFDRLMLLAHACVYTRKLRVVVKNSLFFRNKQLKINKLDRLKKNCE